MSPLACVLHGKGHRVTGSDMRESDVTRMLASIGIDVTIGHHAELVEDADVVTYSTAIPQTNVELVEARERGIEVRHRSGLLASLCAVSEAVGVAGTHGKTTTSALLTHILVENNVDPSCIIGAEVSGLQVGARVGQSRLFVLESDESDGTLDVLPLTHLVVTNVDVDHLDYFGTFEDVQECFVDAVLASRCDIDRVSSRRCVRCRRRLVLRELMGKRQRLRYSRTSSWRTMLTRLASLAPKSQGCKWARGSDSHVSLFSSLTRVTELLMCFR